MVILLLLTKRAGRLVSAVHRLADDKGAVRLRDKFMVLIVVCMLVYRRTLQYQKRIEQVANCHAYTLLAVVMRSG